MLFIQTYGHQGCLNKTLLLKVLKDRSNSNITRQDITIQGDMRRGFEPENEQLIPKSSKDLLYS